MFGMGATALDLVMQMRSCIETTCRRCHGPIQPGDLVVSEPGGRAADMLHRSCLFTREVDAKAARDWRRRKTHPRATEADPRQADLFAPALPGQGSGDEKDHGEHQVTLPAAVRVPGDREHQVHRGSEGAHDRKNAAKRSGVQSASVARGRRG
jgi:hypothetical protein